MLLSEAESMGDSEPTGLNQLLVAFLFLEKDCRRHGYSLVERLRNAKCSVFPDEVRGKGRALIVGGFLVSAVLVE
jgi:hypothetical protein